MRNNHFNNDLINSFVEMEIDGEVLLHMSPKDLSEIIEVPLKVIAKLRIKIWKLERKFKEINKQKFNLIPPKDQ